MVNSETAVARHFCLALSAAFTQPGAHLLSEPCTYTSRPRAHVCSTTSNVHCPWAAGRHSLATTTRKLRKSDRLTFAIFWLQRRRFCSAMHLFAGLNFTHWRRIQNIITFPPDFWRLYRVNKLLLHADKHPTLVAVTLRASR